MLFKNRYVHIRAQILPVNKTQRLLLELLLENPKLTYDELADLRTNKMTIEEKAKLIIKDIRNEKGNDPCQIFRNIVKNEYINMHGPFITKYFFNSKDYLYIFMI